MAKGGSGGNKAQLARITFLNQAAEHLLQVRLSASKAAPSTLHSNPIEKHVQATIASQPAQTHKCGLPLLYTSQLCAVAQKSQIRLSQDLKRRFCKACKLPQVERQTCTTTIENKSRAAAKKWADVEVTVCTGCGTSKRRPIGATRQRKKAARTAPKENGESRTVDTNQQTTMTGTAP